MTATLRLADHPRSPVPSIPGPIQLPYGFPPTPRTRVSSLWTFSSPYAKLLSKEIVGRGPVKQVAMQVNSNMSSSLHTPPRKPGGVDSLCGVATLLFKVPRGPYTGAPAIGLTNLLNEVVLHGMNAVCDLSTPEAFCRSLPRADLNIHSIS
jgi:hypothetical protein